MKNKLLGLAISSVLFSLPVLASPVYRVNADVAQGNIGNGLTVVLAPGQPVLINFSTLGEKITSMTPGDRSRFVFKAMGSVVHLKRIKPIIFEGEYSGGGDTTLIITTTGASGQKVYPVTVRFSDRRPGYSVVEISPDGGMEPIPARIPQPKIPLTTVQAPPYRLPVADLVTLPPDKSTKVLTVLPPPPVLSPAPVLSTPELKVEKTPLQTIPNVEPKPKTKAERVPTAEAIALQEESRKFEKAGIIVDPTPKAEVAIAAPQESAKVETNSSIKKLTNHQQANAIVIGMMRSKAPYYEYRKGQDAVWLLRKGKSLKVAAKYSGLSVSRLQKFIELGSRKNA